MQGLGHAAAVLLFLRSCSPFNSCQKVPAAIDMGRACLSACTCSKVTIGPPAMQYQQGAQHCAECIDARHTA